MSRAWQFAGLSARGDLGLLAMWLLAGSFLIYQRQDDILSGERMQAFIDFCRAAGIP